MSPKKLIITGGEPLVRKDILYILKILSQKISKEKIILETNCFYNINDPMNWSENTFWQSEAIFLSDSNGIVSLKTHHLKGEII